MKTFENDKYEIKIAAYTNSKLPFAIWIAEKGTDKAIRIDLEKPLIQLFGSKWRVIR